MPSFVVAITATRHRLPELTRLLRALESLDQPLGAWVVVDNGAQRDVAELLERAAFPTEYVAPRENMGCGGALRLGEERALERFGEQFTHIWVLDDDVVPEPAALGLSLLALREVPAAAAAPVIAGPDGLIGWESSLVDTRKFALLKSRLTPAEFLAEVGPEPIPFEWTQGICLLYTRRVLVELGPHADDYWIRGEDIEFSLRITARWTAVLVPSAVVRHLMPEIGQTPETIAVEYRKQCAMVQNVAYLGLHVPHARRILSKIPGRFYWHFHNWGLSWRTLLDAVRLFWQGAIRRRPAGHPACGWPMKPR